MLTDCFPERLGTCVDGHVYVMINTYIGQLHINDMYVYIHIGIDICISTYLYKELYMYTYISVCISTCY
jgi:hypothetical protein